MTHQKRSNKKTRATDPGAQPWKCPSCGATIKARNQRRHEKQNCSGKKAKGGAKPKAKGRTKALAKRAA